MARTRESYGQNNARYQASLPAPSPGAPIVGNLLGRLPAGTQPPTPTPNPWQPVAPTQPAAPAPAQPNGGQPMGQVANRRGGSGQQQQPQGPMGVQGQAFQANPWSPGGTAYQQQQGRGANPNMGPGAGGAPVAGGRPSPDARNQRLAAYQPPQQQSWSQPQAAGRPGVPQQGLAPQPMGQAGGQPMGQPGMNIQSSIQPQTTYQPNFMQQAGNMAAAQAVPAMSDLRNMSGRPGISLGSGAIQAGMGQAAGQMLGQGMANRSAGQQQMGWQNAQNNLAGQQARNQEGLGWGNLQAQGLQNQLANQNAQQGNMYNFLRQAYGGL